jgi:hypothetical protein
MHRSRSGSASRFRWRDRGRSIDSRLSTDSVASESPGGSRDQPPGVVVKHCRERERPEPSVIWQTCAVAFITGSLGAAIAALTASESVAVRSAELWIITCGLTLASALCFLAHWDVNRGRRVKEYETEELPPGYGEEG